MHVVADTEALVSDGVITPGIAAELEMRSRGTMMRLAINAVLCTGILSATFGLIFWLADALAVAVIGGGMLAAGIGVLSRGSSVYAMFGNAAALIGSGMLVGGAGFELFDSYRDSAGWAMLGLGVPIAAVAGRAMVVGGLTTRFVAGSILLMGTALHLTGLGIVAEDYAITGLGRAALLFYGSVAIAAAGLVTNVRLVTALAIVPFAQMLDTGTAYFHAAYVFYSPESTLTILQMSLLIAALVWGAARLTDRFARHARVAAVMAFVVANLAALVGSLWGDYVGETVWGPGYSYWSERSAYDSYEQFRAVRTAFRDSAIYIGDGLYTVLWGVALAGLIFWAAARNNRGLFNASLTFAGIHAYTQMFESFGHEPLAYVIGGLALIPMAWGVWRLNQRWLDQTATRA